MPLPKCFPLIVMLALCRYSDAAQRIAAAVDRTLQLPLIAQPLLLSMLLMFIVVPSSCFVVRPLMLSYAVGMCIHHVCVRVCVCP